MTKKEIKFKDAQQMRILVLSSKLKIDNDSKTQDKIISILDFAIILGFKFVILDLQKQNHTNLENHKIKIKIKVPTPIKSVKINKCWNQKL